MCRGTRHEGPIISFRSPSSSICSLYNIRHILWAKAFPGYTFHQHLFHGTNLLISTYNVISEERPKYFPPHPFAFFRHRLCCLANRLLMKWAGAVSGGWWRKQTQFEGKTRKLIFFLLSILRRSHVLLLLRNFCWVFFFFLIFVRFGN